MTAHNMANIQSAIISKFAKHRIVFWYDTKKEMRSIFESIDLPEITKLEIKNNEFSLKYRILREEFKQKFLLYFEGPEPEYPDNWLLDVQLANTVFSADQVSLWMAEMDLSPVYYDTVKDHTEFFQSEARRHSLKAILEPNDTIQKFQLRMLAVCVNSGSLSNLESILETLLAEHAAEKTEKYDLLKRCSLEAFLWESVKHKFAYESASPGIHDFTIQLFKSCFDRSVGEQSRMNNDALIFLKKWKDSIKHSSSFRTLSENCAKILTIDKNLNQIENNQLMDVDLFKAIDQKLIKDLIKQVVDNTISRNDCEKVIRVRKDSYWYADFQDIYEGIYYASLFIDALHYADLKISSLQDGIRKYEKTWYLLDQYYRKFIYHCQTTKLANLFESLNKKVEGLYSNNYLRVINDCWQAVIDPLETWDAAPIIRQGDFYARFVSEFGQRDTKVAVIISDALRYEVGKELLEVIKSEDKFLGEIQPMLGLLPSYTQLGMAALLPHEQILITPDANVLADGQNTAGLENRNKILGKFTKKNASAIRYDEFIKLNHEESRYLVKENQVIYIYHNQIDAIGDKTETEGQVFGAVETAIKELSDLVKKLVNSNLSYIIITTDHGFIYQNQPIDEAEFSTVDLDGKEIFIKNRRFAVGTGPKPVKSAKIFTAKSMGLSGDYEIQIPKSISRLKLQGSGSRYVHGGASMQEVILPVLAINKQRVSDVNQVDVDVIAPLSAVITSGQLAIKFIQRDSVSAKLQPRTLKIGIFASDNELLSETKEIKFDLSAENIRERERIERFLLESKAENYNNQTVFLKLMELEPGTSYYKEYQSIAYQIKRSFTTDF